MQRTAAERCEAAAEYRSGVDQIGIRDDAFRDRLFRLGQIGLDDAVDQFASHGVCLTLHGFAFLPPVEANVGFLAELAGLRGAVVGTLLTVLVAMAIVLPLGVATAVYLEEFAPANRLTDLVEVNINNLAAVPSIVFGLLGLVVFGSWALFMYLRSFSGTRVGAVMAMEEDVDSRAPYRIVVRRTLRGQLRIVHLVMGMRWFAPGVIFVLNQVEAAKAAETLELAAQAAEQ